MEATAACIGHLEPKKGALRYHWYMPEVQYPVTAERHPFQTDDRRLLPIAEKVKAGERLSTEDGLTLYRTGDILAVGWLANSVRERMWGNVAYFNVNRHINPTN